VVPILIGDSAETIETIETIIEIKATDKETEVRITEASSIFLKRATGSVRTPSAETRISRGEPSATDARPLSPKISKEKLRNLNHGLPVTQLVEGPGQDQGGPAIIQTIILLEALECLTCKIILNSKKATGSVRDATM
jgi:hypothetical protein